MAKITEQWFLYQFVDGEMTPLSKPFKTREQAERARAKFSEKEQKSIALGLIKREV